MQTNRRIRKFLLLLLLCFLALGVYGNDVSPDPPYQSITVTGVVTDASTNEPLIGVTVSIKGTTTGVITGIDGEYSIIVPDTAAILIFSYVGYAPQEIELGNRTVIDVLLVQDLISLDEVIVIGYGVQKKSDVTGAISSIDAEDFESMPVSSATVAMQGRAAGVQVIQNSGSPGSEVSIKIRGTGTINNSDPLYVVDGFIKDNIEYLNPNDIEDIQILKDASSAAIYGARAANGVVVVTTKKGQEGKVNVGLSATWGVSDFWNIPNVMDKYEYKDFIDSIYVPIDPTDIFLSNVRDSLRFENYAVDDWLDLLSQKGVTQKYNVEVSGGNEKTRYYFSGSTHNETGIIKKSSLSKQTARMNIESTLSEIFTLRGEATLTTQTREKINEGYDNIFKAAISTPPTNHIYADDASSFSYDDEERSITLISEALGWNPYTRLWYRDLEDILTQYAGNVELETKLSNSIRNVTRATYDNQTIKGTEFLKRYNPAITEYYNDINYDDNAFYKSVAAINKWQVQSVFTFSKSFSQHNLDMVAAIDLEGYKYEFLEGRKSMAPGYESEFHSLSATYLNPQTADNNRQERSLGIPFRLNYNFASKYYFQANFRADASSIFAEEDRWGYFPSLSLGWTLSNEQFMEGIEKISYLKMRANWGLAGNNRIDVLASQNIILTSNQMTFVTGRNPINHAGWAAVGAGNPNISWEKTRSINFGLDFGFFENSLSGSFDVFDRYTYDMLLQLPQPDYLGTDEATWQNAGEVQNRGFDAILGFKRVLGKFSFDISGNFTKIYNKVMKLGEDGNPVYGGYFDENSDLFTNTYVTITSVGKPIAMFYGYQIDRSKYDNGLWRNEDRENLFAGSAIPPVSDPYNQIKAGDFIFKDLNKDNIIDEKDKTFIGNPHPNFTYGLNISLKYSNFDLAIFFQGVYGNDILNMQRYYMYSNDADNNVISGLMDMTYTPDNTDAPYPTVAPGSRDNDNFRVSDFFVEDGSYFRLKNLQIGYTFPQKLLGKVKIENLRVFIGGYNLLTFTDYSGFDPEIGTLNNLFIGIDQGAYPQARTFTGGIMLNF